MLIAFLAQIYGYLFRSKSHKAQWGLVPGKDQLHNFYQLIRSSIAYGQENGNIFKYWTKEFIKKKHCKD